jgi:Bax protein
VPADLGTKDGSERKALFITAILPVVLEVNQRVLVDREQLLHLRDKMAADPLRMSPIERIWLEDSPTATTRRSTGSTSWCAASMSPPSMAIAQAVSSRAGALLSPPAPATPVRTVICAGTPQPFQCRRGDRGLYRQLNTHPAYAGFRTERAAMRQRARRSRATA